MQRLGSEKMNTTEERLERLRNRVKQIRSAKQWLKSYQIVAPAAVSAALVRSTLDLQITNKRPYNECKRIKDQSKQ